MSTPGTEPKLKAGEANQGTQEMLRRRELLERLLAVLRQYRPQTTLEEAKTNLAGLLAGTILVHPHHANPDNVLVLATDEDQFLIKHCNDIDTAKSLVSGLRQKYPGRATVIFVEHEEDATVTDPAELDRYFRPQS